MRQNWRMNFVRKIWNVLRTNFQKEEMELVQFHGKNVCPSKTSYLIQTAFSWQKASRRRRIVFFCSKKFQPFLNDSHEGFKSNAKKIPRNWSWVALLGLLFWGVHCTSTYMPQIFGLSMTDFDFSAVVCLTCRQAAAEVKSCT